ncbi:DsrE family protein [Tabrizicola sp.]|uniref:DsrE family protein n=1 Tax=Tabrizicola sp. TaxID=2005166 RepID=UPI00286B0253|nr:DsrE family protein [Tabrizicola sp.]
MAKVLVHIHSGPDAAVKATLGALVALTAAKAGHQVSVFFAGDGVHCLAPAHADVTGAGTGRLGDHLEGLRAAAVAVFASGMSAKARGYDETLVAPFGGKLAMPDRLLELSLEADSTLCY